MNDWGQPIGFSIESRKLPIFPQGIVLEGKFSRLERFRSDHPMEELYEAFVSKQDESRWTYLPYSCLLYTSPSPRDATLSRMPSSA